jgi:hypothetical protein
MTVLSYSLEIPSKTTLLNLSFRLTAAHIDDSALAEDIRADDAQRRAMGQNPGAPGIGQQVRF